MINIITEILIKLNERLPLIDKEHCYSIDPKTNEGSFTVWVGNNRHTWIVEAPLKSRRINQIMKELEDNLLVLENIKPDLNIDRIVCKPLVNTDDSPQ